jgi:3-hydroxybutyryl-CoA dehydrogenase
MVSDIQTIAVIGAGDVGREIALACLLGGYRTILEDISESRLERAAAWIADRANASAQASSRLRTASNVEEAVREADLIIEAVAEEMEMKVEMFTIFDKFAKPDAIFASSSPSISIVELAAVTFCPGRCIGLRFVSSAGHADVLELVHAPDTSEETVGRCAAIGRRMSKEIVITRDIGKRDSPQRTQRAQRRIGEAPSLEGAGADDAAEPHELSDFSRD